MRLHSSTTIPKSDYYRDHRDLQHHREISIKSQPRLAKSSAYNKIFRGPENSISANEKVLKQHQKQLSQMNLRNSLQTQPQVKKRQKANLVAPRDPKGLISKRSPKTGQAALTSSLHGLIIDQNKN